MQTWVALLRGINVGPHNRLPMADLRGVLAGLGYERVKTILQSGNAVFDAPGKAPGLAAAIQSHLAVAVPVVVIEAGELAAIVDDNPFVARGVDPKELHAAFLSKAPGRLDVDADAYRPDEFAFGRRVIYLRQPNGVTGSKLPDWSRLMPGVTVTARNWATTVKVRAAL